MSEDIEVAFDPIAHRYTVYANDPERQHGMEYPGVTGVLKTLGLIDTQWYTQEAMERGSAVHEAIMLIEQGVLDLGAYRESDPIYGYLEAWQKCKRETELKVVETEALRADPVCRYATILDGIGEYKGKPAIWDLKSGPLRAWHGLQLAAGTGLTDIRQRYVIQLDDDGDYHLHSEYKDEAFSSRIWDRGWLSAITLYWLKRTVFEGHVL